MARDATVRAASISGGEVKLYRGGVRHDYKSPSSAITRLRSVRWLPFAAGIAAPLAFVLVWVCDQAYRAPGCPKRSGPASGRRAGSANRRQRAHRRDARARAARTRPLITRRWSCW